MWTVTADSTDIAHGGESFHHTLPQASISMIEDRCPADISNWSRLRGYLQGESRDPETAFAVAHLIPTGSTARFEGNDTLTIPRLPLVISASESWLSRGNIK